MENIEVEIKKLGELVESATKSAEAKSKVATEAMDAKMMELKTALETKSTDEIAVIQKQMQAQYDEFVSQRPVPKTAEVKTINAVMEEKLSGIKFAEQQENEVTNSLRSKSGSFRIEMPEVKTMTLVGNLTGDQVASYGPRQAILPSQKVNLRDLVPTLNTETGLYIFYKETAVANNFAFQAEGCVKGENSYTLSEVKVVQNYLAGIVTFSKQMATSLPWLTIALPRLLMRDFHKKENASFYTTITNAAIVNTSAESDNVKKLVDFINAQYDLNYNVSAIIVSNADMAKLIKSTYTQGYYSGAGGATLNAMGNGMSIMGVPVIGASWATTGKALLIDNDFLERVQVKGLAIELSYENNDNFTRNMVTARIECQEEINLMLAASANWCTLA